MNKCSDFDYLSALRDRINQYRPLTAGELDYLNESFIIEYTHDSTAIEGNTLTLDETAIVLREGVTVGGKSVKEYMEVVGHRDAVLFVEGVVRNQEPLTEQLIKQLHTLVLADKPEDRGEYRRVPVEIKGSPVQLPYPDAVPAHMADLISVNNKAMQDLHPIERAAIFHLRFEHIHPFIDGNGRTGRLLLNLELMKNGFLPINIKYQDRQRYFDALRAWQVENRHDAEPMKALCAEYERAALEQRIHLLEVANNPTIEP